MKPLSTALKPLAIQLATLLKQPSICLPKPLFILAIALFLLPLAAACDHGPGQLIFKISSQSNAHAEQWDETSYLEEICFDDFFAPAYSTAGDPHACTGSNTVLWLSGPSNAHAAESASAAYLEEVCFGDLSCTARNVSACPSGEACIATISSLTNAHVSMCSVAGAYDIKVCCSTGSASASDPKLSISSFALEPATVSIEGTGTEAVDVPLELINTGATADAYVTVEVFSPDGTTKVYSDTSGVQSVGASPVSFAIAPFPVDETWEEGLYTVTATAFDSSGTVHDSKSKQLNVGLKKVPVPGLNLLLLPVLLAGVFLILKKK